MKLPLDRDALRDQAVEARVDRVWERLEGRLEGELGRSVRGGTSAGHGRTALALAAGFALGLGVNRLPDSAPPTLARAAPLAETQPAGVAPSAPESSARADLATEPPPAEEAAAPAAPPAEPRPSVTALRRPARTRTSDATTEGASATPAWAAACASYDYAKAFELLDAAGNVAAALQQATNDERLCIAAGSRQREQADVAKLALQRVLDDSDDADRGAIAAAQLARIYEEEGDFVEQRRYEQLKEIRSKGRLLSEAALCEKLQVQAGVGAHRSVLELAQQYENQYPSGTCSATVEALVAAAKAKLGAAPTEPEAEPEPEPAPED